jgi:hypothetical protein
MNCAQNGTVQGIAVRESSSKQKLVMLMVVVAECLLCGSGRLAVSSPTQPEDGHSGHATEGLGHWSPLPDGIETQWCR